MTSAPSPPRGRLSRIAGALLVAYALLLGFFLLVPSAAPPSDVLLQLRKVAERAGLPAPLTAGASVEFAANVLVFVPVLALVLLLRPRLRWIQGVALGFLVSLSVEVVQALFLPARSATVSDVIANTIGAVLGASLGWWMRGSGRGWPGTRRGTRGFDDPPP